MIKDMRVVEWTEGRLFKTTRWDIQIKREGSNKWETLTYVRLKRKPKEIAGEKKTNLNNGCQVTTY